MHILKIANFKEPRN